MAAVLSLFCVLIIAEAAFGETNCHVKQYSLRQPKTCAVAEHITVDFPIKDVSPLQTDCKQTETVCVKITREATTFTFGGTFLKTMTLLTVNNANIRAQIPVVFVEAKQSFAEPSVGIFSSNELKFAGLLSFTVTLTTPTITADATLIDKSTDVDCDANKLCFRVTGQNVKLWGTKNNLDSITVSGSGNTKVVIPLILTMPNEVYPVPPMLTINENGQLESYKSIVVPFDATTVTSNTGALVKKETCKTTEACYELIQAPNSATFTGVIPANPHTIKINGNSDQYYISYYFENAGSIVKNSAMAVVMASFTVYMSRM